MPDESDISLERLEPAHARILYEELKNPSLYTFIPQNPPETVKFLESTYVRLASGRSPDGRERWLNWAVCSAKEKAFVGTVQATVYEDRTADIAYAIFEQYWRRGYATQACRLMIDCLHRSHDAIRIEALVDTRNAASIALLEKLEFSRIALVMQADNFKGASSDEYRFRLEIR